MTKENNKVNVASAKVAKVSSQIKAATVEAEEKPTAIKVNTKNTDKKNPAANTKGSSSVAVKIQKTGSKQTGAKSNNAKPNSSRQATSNSRGRSGKASTTSGRTNAAVRTAKNSSKTRQNSRILSVVELGNDAQHRANVSRVSDGTMKTAGMSTETRTVETAKVQDAAASAKQKSKTTSKKKKPVIILLVILVIGLIAGVAVWAFNRSNRNMCTVDFESNGGSKVESVEVVCGGRISQPKDPEKDGFDFREWSYRGRKFNFKDSTVNEDMILVAKWDANEDTETVTISFDSNGGSEIEDLIIKAGTATMAPVDPVRDGYTFDGWYLDDEKFDFSQAIDEDITLVARWSGGTEGGNNVDSGVSRPSVPNSNGSQNSNTQPTTPDSSTPGGSSGNTGDGSGNGNGNGNSGNTGGNTGGDNTGDGSGNNGGSDGSGDGDGSTTTPGGDNNSNVPNPDDSSQNQP